MYGLARAAPQLGCMIGNLAQEVAASSEPLRQLCGRAFAGWASALDPLIAAAAAEAGVRVDGAALARHFVVVYEGALVLAKASGDPAIVDEQLDLYKRHVRGLLDRDSPQRRPRSRG